MASSFPPEKSSESPAFNSVDLVAVFPPVSIVFRGGCKGFFSFFTCDFNVQIRDGSNGWFGESGDGDQERF